MSKPILSAREIAEKIARAAMNICGVAVSQVDAGNWGMDKYDEAKAEMTKIIEAALIAEREAGLKEGERDALDVTRVLANTPPEDWLSKAEIHRQMAVLRRPAILSRQTPTGTGESRG